MSVRSAYCIQQKVITVVLKILAARMYARVIRFAPRVRWLLDFLKRYIIIMRLTAPRRPHSFSYPPARRAT